jgi:hypothetical protein
MSVGGNTELYNQCMNEMCKNKFGTTFDHIHCFEILHCKPKWEEYLNLQQEKQIKKNERKKHPTGTKKFKKQQEEKELIKTCMKEADLDGTGQKPIVLEGITDTHARNGNGCSSPKDQHLANISESFKQIASIIPQLMMGFLAGGNNQDNTASLIPNKVCHELVVSQACLQAAQMEKQAIDLEEENKHCSKKQKTSMHDDGEKCNESCNEFGGNGPSGGSTK